MRDALSSPVRSGADLATAALDLLRRGRGEITSTVQGDSMGVTLPAGTRIRIRCGGGGDVSGQIVALVIASRLVAHRVILPAAGGRRHIVTRGDGSLLCDPPIPLHRVVGEVLARWDGTSWVPPAPAPTPSRLGAWGTRIGESLVRGGLRIHWSMGHGLYGLLAIGLWCLRRVRNFTT